MEYGTNPRSDSAALSARVNPVRETPFQRDVDDSWMDAIRTRVVESYNKQAEGRPLGSALQRTDEKYVMPGVDNGTESWT